MYRKILLIIMIIATVVLIDDCFSSELSDTKR